MAISYPRLTSGNRHVALRLSLTAQGTLGFQIHSSRGER
jgi:hypothetical protein